MRRAGLDDFRPSGRVASPPLVLPAVRFKRRCSPRLVENARSMAVGPQGTVFVGSQYVGKVHAVVITFANLNHIRRAVSRLHVLRHTA